jgi:hypothetical protein
VPSQSRQNQYLFREIVSSQASSVVSADFYKVFCRVIHRLQMQRPVKANQKVQTLKTFKVLETVLHGHLYAP